MSDDKRKRLKQILESASERVSKEPEWLRSEETRNHLNTAASVFIPGGEASPEPAKPGTSRKLISLQTDVISAQAANCLVYVQIGYVGLFLFHRRRSRPLIRLELFSPVHDPGTGYSLRGFCFRWCGRNRRLL